MPHEGMPSRTAAVAANSRIDPGIRFSDGGSGRLALKLGGRLEAVKEPSDVPCQSAIVRHSGGPHTR
jgi:hypothetical protein